jgi:hypothetical protein
MQSNSGSAFSGARPSKARKPYSAPKFRISAPDQAEAELQAKGLPGDRGAQQLLKLLADKRRNNKPQP